MSVDNRDAQVAADFFEVVVGLLERNEEQRLALTLSQSALLLALSERFPDLQETYERARSRTTASPEAEKTRQAIAGLRVIAARFRGRPATE